MGFHAYVGVGAAGADSCINLFFSSLVRRFLFPFCSQQVTGDWELARKALKSMRHQELSVDVVVYGAAIGACARAGE